MSEKYKLESLHGKFYDIKHENGMILCPKCNARLVLQNPYSDPDYFHYRCINCLSDYRMKNKADKDFKIL